MAEELLSTSDDAQLRGGNTTSATSGADVNKFNAEMPGGNGQVQSTNTQEANAYATSIRRWNPLTKFSSFTYNITLYMLTPEAANYFAATGNLPEAQADGEYFIIAQSGGINSMLEPRAITLDPQSEPGPGKPGYDYYIDDLNIESYLLGSDGQKTATTSTAIHFKVVEPIGFTFLTKLSNASSKINQRSKLVLSGDISTRPNLYQQHYMVGVKFYGYDQNGQLIPIDKIGNQHRALNDQYGVYERLFPLIVGKVNWKIDGRATTYSFEAVLQHLQVAFGVKRGTIINQANFEGATVGEVLGQKETNNNKSLIGWLNAKQVDLKNNKNITIEQWYDIDWSSDKEFASKIFNSPMITDSDYSKETSAMTNANTVQEVNVKEAEKSNSINTKTKSINIAAGTSIVNAIDQIIVKSQYISGTLMKEINSRIESQTKDNPKGKLVWYSVKPIVKCVGRDNQTKDWAYHITYQIAPYEVSYVKSPYVSARSKYYGPVKEYSYFLTGKNTEVISFEMSYDNSYYIITPGTTTKDDTSKNKNVDSNKPRHVTGGQNSNPTAGSPNSGSLIAESVRADLYNPADQSVVTIRVMGDPDFLMEAIGTKYESYTFSKFYGKDNSINPYGGQIYAEVIFKVAEDYNNKGLLDVDLDQTIGFYPKEIQSILGNKGIIYRINKVLSSFNRGKFEQTLEMFLVSPSELLIQKDEQPARLDNRTLLNNVERNIEAGQSSSNTLPNTGERKETANLAAQNESQLGGNTGRQNSNTNTNTKLPASVNNTSIDDAVTGKSSTNGANLDSASWGREQRSPSTNLNNASTSGNTTPPGG